MTFHNFESVEAYLDKIPKFQSKGAPGADFDLSRFARFCEFLENPQHQFPSIHVAGTNGKGSTCRMLGSVFQQADYQAGIYTSPHVNKFSERFQINSQPIPDDELVFFFENYADKLEEYRLTYFEISTAIAFWWFAQQEVDIAVIEVGLGGRLDATNLIDPLVSVITSISLDHTDILGETIADITREKAGIIKDEHPVVIGDLPASARHEILAISREKNSSVFTIDKFNPICLKPGTYQLVIDKNKTSFHTPLMAPIQAKNVAIAWQVLQQIRNKFPVSAAQFRHGLSQVDIGSGRFERLLDSQRWYFDGGHNLEAVKALKQSTQAVGNLDNAILVLSMMKDKVRQPVIEIFLEFSNIYYHQLNLERAASFNDINYWLPQAKSFPNDRVQQFLLNDLNSELVIFAGSFYFYDTVRDWVQPLNNH